MGILNWLGGDVRDRVHDAARQGIDETTAAAVIHAKSNHPWSNQTGTLEGSLQMRPAEVQGDIVRGQWGSFTVLYAIYLELGGWAYLRPAADAEYPKLAGRIKAAMQ